MRWLLKNPSNLMVIFLVPFLDFCQAFSFPELLTQDAVEKIILEKAPMPKLSLEILRALLAGEASRNLREPAANVPVIDNGNGGELVMIDPFSGSTSALSLNLQSTGNSEVDKAVHAQLVESRNIASQAYFHLRLADATDCNANDADFTKFLEQLDLLVKQQDQLFFPLNRDFITAWALGQYEAELTRTMRAALEAGLYDSDPIAKFKSALKILDPMTRRQIWKLLSKGGLLKTKFYFIQESVQKKAAREYIERYLPLADEAQFNAVLSLIDRTLREPEFTAPVIEWCLNHARTVEDLLDILQNELWDINFLRYLDKLKAPSKKDPFKEISYSIQENDSRVFLQVLRLTLILAQTKFAVSQGDFLKRLFQRIIKGPESVEAPFILESFLHFLEQVLGDSDLDLSGAESALSELAQEIKTKCPQNFIAYQASFLERVHYLREEIAIYQQGWLPPSKQALARAFAIAQGNEIADGSLIRSAAVRYLDEIPSQMLAEVSATVVGPVADKSQVVLPLDQGKQKLVLNCYEALTIAWENVPRND